MLAKYSPYTESHSHAMPLGEVWPHRGGAFEEIRGIRRSECKASRRRLGIRKEKVWFQALPQGIWRSSTERATIRAALQKAGREVSHFDPSQTLEADEEVFEAEVG
jgi:LmbE family N-acetylglucosaminyl deacetylase